MPKTQSCIDNTDVEEVWNLCCEAYSLNGFKLAFPKNTIPQNTYQWRYASAIAKKFNEWKFDPETAKRFLYIAVKHSKSAGTMHKGLAALHQGNMLDVCYNKLLDDSNNFAQTITTLSNVKSWLDNKIDGSDLYESLIKRKNKNSFCNLTMWYQASRITPLYIALSKSCVRALVAIDDEYERSIIPRNTSLYLMRSSFLEEANNKRRAKIILGSDFLGN